jgi:hypothetical protein
MVPDPARFWPAHLRRGRQYHHIIPTREKNHPSGLRRCSQYQRLTRRRMKPPFGGLVLPLIMRPDVFNNTPFRTASAAGTWAGFNENPCHRISTERTRLAVAP